jgi:hypothetical protein
MIDAAVGSEDLVISVVRTGETFDLKARRRAPLVAGAGG